MYKVLAYQVASAIHVNEARQQLNWSLLFQDSDELFYEYSAHKFIYIFQYGMIGFFNLSADEIDSAVSQVYPFCKDHLKETISEAVDVHIKNTVKVEFDKVILVDLNAEMIRLVMLYASQSVALTRYSEITEALLVETNEHTKYLENKGRLDISGQKLKRFIGKTLNIKNKISENLYIFDSPDIVWEDETLNKLNSDLKQTFDLKDRYRLIHDRVDIIKENLELFKDIMDHKESSKLEWIIIILILVEVVDMFILKLL